MTSAHDKYFKSLATKLKEGTVEQILPTYIEDFLRGWQNNRQNVTGNLIIAHELTGQVFASVTSAPTQEDLHTIIEGFNTAAKLMNTFNPAGRNVYHMPLGVGNGLYCSETGKLIVVGFYSPFIYSAQQAQGDVNDLVTNLRSKGFD